jgi:peptide/nickel transport system permease protein
MADGWRRFRSNRPALVALVVLALVAVFAFAGPALWRYDHTVQRSITDDAGPSLSHPLGAARAGFDVMAQVMRGAQRSLSVAVLAGLVAGAIGTVCGAVAATRRGLVDAVLMRAADVALVVPALVVVLALAGAGSGTTWIDMAMVIGLFGWAAVARVVRSVALPLGTLEFVDASRAFGASSTRVLLRHVLPNAAGAAIVATTLVMSGAVLIEAAMSFVGFGVTTPDTSLGLLVATGETAAFTRPWLFLAPGAFVVVICIAINLVGDGLRDALDVRR